MKRLLLLVLALIMSALVPQLLRAQETLPELLEEDEAPTGADSTDGPQRIGIPAARFELEPGESGSIAGYCFDEHLIAPTRTTLFGNVLAGGDAATVRTSDGRTRSLVDAVRDGDVLIRAHQLNVGFTNRTGQPMELTLARPAVLWDRPAGAVNPLAVAALDAPGASYDARQRAIWRVTSSERRLQALGYPTGSVYNFDARRMKSAMNAFQREHGLAETAELDLATVERIASVDAGARERLRALGFQTREPRFARENLGSQIRAFENFLGRRPTGRWSSDLELRLASTESIMPQLNAIRPAKGQQIADALAADNSSSVLTYVNDGASLLLLTQTPAGVELWSRTGSKYRVIGREADAVRRVDAAAGKLAQRASKEGRVVMYAGVANGAVTDVIVGDHKVSVDTRELAGFAAGGEIPTALAQALAPLVPAAASNPWTGGNATSTALVVYRSPLQQGRAPASLERLGLEQVDGRKLAGALERHYAGRVNLFVSDDLRIGASRFDASMGGLSRPTRSASRMALAE